MKSKYFNKNDSIVIMEKLVPSGYYLVQLSGNTRDKIRCDDYKMATGYYRAFCKIAKSQG